MSSTSPPLWGILSLRFALESLLVIGSVTVLQKLLPRNSVAWRRSSRVAVLGSKTCLVDMLVPFLHLLTIEVVMESFFDSIEKRRDLPVFDSFGIDFQLVELLPHFAR